MQRFMLYQHRSFSKFALPAAESTLHPAVFDAIASLRGDVANESVQHRELAQAIAKDVLEPLGQLKESAEMVVRVVRLLRLTTLSSCVAVAAPAELSRHVPPLLARAPCVIFCLAVL